MNGQYGSLINGYLKTVCSIKIWYANWYHVFFLSSFCCHFHFSIRFIFLFLFLWLNFIFSVQLNWNGVHWMHFMHEKRLTVTKYKRKKKLTKRVKNQNVCSCLRSDKSFCGCHSMLFIANRSIHSKFSKRPKSRN